MSEARPVVRPKRKRCTHAVLSDLEMIERWWAPQKQPQAVVAGCIPQGQSARRFREMRFLSGDPLDRLQWARHAVICLSLIIPVMLVGRLDGPRALLRQLRSDPKQSAAESLAQGHPEQAIMPLRAALEASPDNPVLLRQLAQAVARVSPAEARRCYNRLDQLGATQDEDRAAHATVLALLHDFLGAKAVLSKVSPGTRSSPAVLHSWLVIWREAGDYSTAASTLEKLASTDKVEVEACIELAEAATKAPIAADILHRIEQRLAESLACAAKEGRTKEIQALAPRLSALPWDGGSARLQAARVLHALPGNPPECRMAAVRLQHGSTLGGGEREELHRAWLDEITACGGLSAQEKDRVTAYFQQQGEHELVAELISAPEALSVTPLYLRRVDSLLALGRWKEVGAMSADAAAPILPQSRLLIQSLSSLYRPGPDTSMAARLLSTALYEARDEKRAAACYTTGCAALDHRLPGLASQAFAAALDLAGDRGGLLESVINKTRQSPLSIAQLLGALDGTAVTSDETVQNKVIYLHLLADRDVDLMSELIRNRRAQAPEDVYLRFLEAFALHKHGDFVQAARLLVPLPRYRWHQGEAAVIASIVAASGNFDRSAALLGKIDTAKLFPEELALVNPWRMQIASRSQLVSTVRETPRQ